tara:strand:- start:2265 stop:2522 length:258 start_codon:yes stop_codon:yes gene_type:complete
MKTYCASCLPKQELFTLEDVEHIIEHVLGIDLPDALRMVKEMHKFHEGIRNGSMNGYPVAKTEPCWDCKHMMPVLLHINEARRDD